MATKKQIIQQFRDFLIEEGLDLFIINATDEYLNEYVSLKSNSRYHLTGFSGSTGDAIITSDEIYLFVDGRYHLQAEKETDPDFITLVKTGIDKSPQKALYEKLAELSDKKKKIGIVSSKISCAGYKELLKIVEDISDIEIYEYEHDPLYKIIDFKDTEDKETCLRAVPVEISGKTAGEKLEYVNNFNKEFEYDLLLITDLTDIAYLTNLRGSEIAYSSCFKAKALVYKEQAYIFTNLKKISSEIKEKFDKNFIFKEEEDFSSFIQNISVTGGISKVCYHPRSTPLCVFRKIENVSKNSAEIKDSFISSLKSVKNISELDYIQECYLKTDIVIGRAICWLNQNLEKEIKISEKDFSDKVKTFFYEEGAYGLSFEPITASGKNTAFIHYTNPDPKKYINFGDLVLLDCGAYFDGGYATDVTRTFLAGGSYAIADSLQKEIYTVVLKGFLRGLNYEGELTGFNLDNAVREVVNANKPAGFEFSHGTGHGVGISVHESPPRIASSDLFKTPLAANMVFTIEPGLYNHEWGGVRIENTVKTVEKSGKITIKTVTRASLDENLINYDMLTDDEKTWLEEYKRFKIG
ncbi:MAG TPA: M24 family metallopeptidase [Candidatus Gastranaerophilales bacterium]|nr:M24 family metallopeptidase [Candidatus Gastranaerophilales bacterium]